MARPNPAVAVPPPPHRPTAVGAPGAGPPEFPARSAEDIFAERIRVELGPREYVLPVLPWAQEDTWRASFDATFSVVLAQVSASSDITEIVGMLGAFPDQMLDALVAYDTSGVLPDRAGIKAVATKMQVFRAVMGVAQATNPLVGIGLATLSPARSPAPSSPRPRGAGRRATSGRN